MVLLTKSPDPASKPQADAPTPNSFVPKAQNGPKALYSMVFGPKSMKRVWKPYKALDNTHDRPS